MSSRQFRSRRRLAAASFAALAAAALLSASPSALAQTPAQSDIVITALDRDQAEAFVSQLATAPASDDQMGRWNNSICIGVAGLPARQGQFIADRIAQRAHAVGLAPGAAGCAPNVSVVVAPDGNGMAQQMFARDESLFAYRYETGVSTLGHEAFDRFLNTERPVRWWHVTRTMSADGEAIGSGGTTPSASGGWEGVQTVRSNGSLLRSTTRQDFSRVVIVVDAGRVGSAQLAALADYLAMVALAQIDPEADTSSYPTIMNLFSHRGGAAVAAMTDWDVAYLEGLYATNRDAPSPEAQQADIARRMLNRRAS